MPQHAAYMQVPPGKLWFHHRQRTTERSLVIPLWIILPAYCFSKNKTRDENSSKGSASFLQSRKRQHGSHITYKWMSLSLLFSFGLQQAGVAGGVYTLYMHSHMRSHLVAPIWRKCNSLPVIMVLNMPETREEVGVGVLRGDLNND